MRILTTLLLSILVNGALFGQSTDGRPGDSLKPASDQFSQPFDSLVHSVTHRIDSLQKLNLPSSHYAHLLDSIQKAGPPKDIQQAEARIAALEKQVNEKAAAVNGSLTYAEKNLNVGIQGVDKVGGSLNQVKIPQIGTLPSSDLANTSLNPPVTTSINDQLGGIDTNIGTPGGINGNPVSEVTKKLDGAKSEGKLPNSQLANGGVANLQKDFKEVQGYSKDVKAIANGDLDSAKHLTGLVEKKAAEMANVGQLQGLTSSIDQYKSTADQAKDPETMRKFAVEEAKKQVANHFAGNEVVLHKAMDQMSQLKQKLPSLSSFADLPKRIPNPLHGQPFTERLVPGLTLQIQSKQHFTVDLNPSLGYRFNGRLTAGIGWNQRVGFQRHHQFGMHALNEAVYGPRSYATFSMGHGFSFMGSVEAMSTNVPKLSVTGPFDKGSRQWVWGVLTGFRKDYKFFGGIRGNWQTLYNLASINYNESPYVDRLQVRMGFEFPFKKKEDRVSKRPRLHYVTAGKAVLHYGTATKGLFDQSLKIGHDQYDIKMLRQEFSRDTLLISRGFSSYRKAKRIVVEGESRYHFAYDRKAKKDVIRNEQGTILATTERLHHVTLADGRSLELVQIYPTQWKFVCEGKELMQATRTGNGVSSNLEFVWDESVKGKDKGLLEMICKVRAGIGE